MKIEALIMNINITQISNEIPFSPHVSDNDCVIYRFISIIFIGVSIISLIFNIRFIIFDRNRLNPLVLSLIINSVTTACLSLPYIIFQSIKCYPVQSYFICSFEGFACFTGGICVMYTMCLLALVQYIKLFHNSSIIYRLIESKNNFLIPFMCWFISFLWSFPPFMDIGPGFMREGQGFDCGLNWKRLTIRSHVYLFLAFILIYFLPLFCLIYTHIRILITIRKLVYRRNIEVSKTAKTMPFDMRHRLIDIFTVAESNRLRHLRIDRRFAKATMITVVHYLLAWTPYATCGMLQMFLAMNYTQYELPSMVLTASALTAKMSVIGQSCVYLFTVRSSDRRFSLSSATLK